MKKLFLLLATFGFLVTPIVSAFGQAAAESALINGMSSTATVKAGSELNHALDHGMTTLAAGFNNQPQVWRSPACNKDQARRRAQLMPCNPATQPSQVPRQPLAAS